MKSSFLKLINLFKLEANYFTLLWWFSPYIDMNQPRYTCVPHPETPSQLPPHPILLGTGFECPVSSIKLGLVIYFTCGNIYVSVLFSQIIPPTLSPTESKILFLCLFCFLTCRVIITIFLNSIYMH